MDLLLSSVKKKTHIFSHSIKKKKKRKVKGLNSFLQKWNNVAEANSFIPEGARFGKLWTEYKIEGGKIM